MMIMTNFLPAAKDYYYNKRWGVIPLKHKSKAPNLLKGHDFLKRRAEEHEFENFDFKNIGIVTGAVSRIIVVDIDEQDKAYKWLEEQGHQLTETVTAKTGKGLHYYFKHPGYQIGSKIKCLPGMDFKGDGGYVVAPPSTVEKTVEAEKGIRSKVESSYEWIRSPEDTEIAECPEWLLQELIKQSERSTSPPLVEELIPEGSRNTTLFSRARSLFKQGYNEGEVYGLLNNLNQSRCIPPVDSNELDEIIASAANYDRGELHISEPSEPEESIGDFLQPMDLGRALEEGIEPPEHLIPDLLYAEGIHSIYSPGGTGKTILALWCCLQVMERGLDILYVDEENGAHHITDLLSCFEADSELIRKHFKYYPAPGLTKEELAIWKQTIEHFSPALVVFDSLADHITNCGLNENDNNDVTWWLKAFAQPVKDAGGAALVLDHVAKDDSVRGARGATAKKNKCDVAWKLKRPKKKEFSRESMGGVELTKDKDRKGSMPYSREFQVGSDFLGKLICEPTDISHEQKQKPLTPNEETALDTLWLKFPEGARHGEWHRATGLPGSTFNRVIGTLVSEGWVVKEEATGIYSHHSQTTPMRVNESDQILTPTNSHTL